MCVRVRRRCWWQDSGVAAFRHAFLLRPLLFRQLQLELLPPPPPTLSLSASAASSLAAHAAACASSFTNAELGSSSKVLAFVLAQTQAAYAADTARAKKARAAAPADALTVATNAAADARALDANEILQVLRAVDAVADGEAAPLLVALGRRAQPN